MYCLCIVVFMYFFFFNDTATTEIYTLSLHDALPISLFLVNVIVTRQAEAELEESLVEAGELVTQFQSLTFSALLRRSEEHTSELQSRQYLVCRLLLEKKKKKNRKSSKLIYIQHITCT